MNPVGVVAKHIELGCDMNKTKSGGMAPLHQTLSMSHTSLTNLTVPTFMIYIRCKI